METINYLFLGVVRLFTSHQDLDYLQLFVFWTFFFAYMGIVGCIGKKISTCILKITKGAN